MHVAGSFLLLLCGLGLAARPAAAQAAPAEGQLAAGVATARQQYATAFFGQPQLYNGSEYIDYAKRYRSQDGHQFFLVPERQSGSVHYNGQLFSPVQLTYDVVLDQVIVMQPTSPITLRLVNEHVRYFTIGAHRFIRLVADSAAGGVVRTGYYEVLADGPAVQVLARRLKLQQEKTVNGGVDVLFIPTDKILLKKAGTYHTVGSKGAVVRLLADQGPAIQQYIRAQKLSFNRTKLEASVVRVSQYYNGLLPAR